MAIEDYFELPTMYKTMTVEEFHILDNIIMDFFNMRDEYNSTALEGIPHMQYNVPFSELEDEDLCYILIDPCMRWWGETCPEVAAVVESSITLAQLILAGYVAE